MHQKAIVLGGGHAGFLAAKILSEHFKEVLIIDRDSKKAYESDAPRPGVPQTAYNHTLIPLGLNLLEKLFPNFAEELVHRGAKKADFFGDSEIVLNTIYFPRFKSNRYFYLMTRKVIDKTIQDLVLNSSNITFQYDTEIKGLIRDEKQPKISGVKLKSRVDQTESTLNADLIVDATGAFSRNLEWLEEIGFTKPPAEQVQIDDNVLTYKARWGNNDTPNWKFKMVRDTGTKKKALFTLVEDDKEGNPQWLFVVTTILGVPLKKTQEDFEKVCLDLGENELCAAIKNATKLTEMGQYRLPKSFRKLFSKMDPVPEGFIAIGDAQAAWPPPTGLGLTVSAFSAFALNEALGKYALKDVPKNYFRLSENRIGMLWERNLTQDIIPLTATTKPSPFVKFVMWYKKKMGEYGAKDPVLWEELFCYTLSENSNWSIFRPSIVLRMLYHSIKRPV